jgi:hypothetical protein
VVPIELYILGTREYQGLTTRLGHMINKAYLFQK